MLFYAVSNLPQHFTAVHGPKNLKIKIFVKLWAKETQPPALVALPLPLVRRQQEEFLPKWDCSSLPQAVFNSPTLCSILSSLFGSHWEWHILCFSILRSWLCIIHSDLISTAGSLSCNLWFKRAYNSSFADYNDCSSFKSNTMFFQIVWCDAPCTTHLLSLSHGIVQACSKSTRRFANCSFSADTDSFSIYHTYCLIVWNAALTFSVLSVNHDKSAIQQVDHSSLRSNSPFPYATV